MAGKRDEPEDIVLKLRQVEVLQGQGMAFGDAVRQIGVTQQTYYRWPAQYGGMNRDQLKRLKELGTENQRLRRAVSDLMLDKMILTEAAPGKLSSPSPRRKCIDHVRQALGVSERRACRTLGQHRSTQRKVPCGTPDEDRLTEDIIELTRTYGRYGYRMITGLLNNAGWRVNHKRVERIWRCEGRTVPQEQAKKGRLWLGDGSCVRLRPEHPNHVCPHEFVQHRTRDGRIFRTLDIIDRFTKEALVIRVDRKLDSTDVVDALTDLFILRGPPEFIRSDDGAEFIAKKVRARIGAVGANGLPLSGGPVSVLVHDGSRRQGRCLRRG